MIRPALLALLLAGCANLHTVEERCGANTRPFVETWPCVKAGAASLPGPYDLKNQYFRTGDLVAEKIAAGQMTETEGRLVMAQTLSRLMSADAARSPVPAYRPTTYQQVGPGTVIAY